MDAEHYQEHLNRVSRSFAFCIARLDGDFRGWVGLAYLLCRILDTVEDAAWTGPEARELAFRDFERFLREGCSPAEARAWASRFPGIPESERLLLLDSARIFQDLRQLPAPLQEKLRAPVLNMLRGMRHFAARQQPGQVLRLRSLGEVNQYCFFVAGLVGELLSSLLGERLPAYPVSRRNLLDAHRFGLFLQKVNLLKDQALDEKEGRFLVPDRAELLASLRADAEGAIRYLLSLPVAEKGFRLFCAWSLFLGLASLPWSEQGWIRGILEKIPRALTSSLLAAVEQVIDDNQALLRLFQEKLRLVPGGRPGAARQPVDSSWLQGVYDGPLGSEDFLALGMA